MNKFQKLKLIRGHLFNWPRWLSDYFKLTNSSDYYLKNGLIFKTCKGAHNTFFHVWVRDCYKTKESIKPKDIVIDIGSNLGFFSILASNLCREGKIYSIEACPSNFKKIKENIKINNIKNIIPFNFAMGSSSKIRELHISKENEGGHGFYKNDLHGRIIKVKGKTLNDFIKENKIEKIDFIKVDCEGAEYEIFESLDNDNFEKIRLLAMEIHQIEGKNPLKLMDLLKRKGFFVEILEQQTNKIILIFAKKFLPPKHLNS